MSHTSTPRRTPALAALLILLLAAAGLAACGGSSGTTVKTAANAAATGTAGSGTTTPTTPGGAPSTGTTLPGRPNAAHFAAVRECLAKKGITLPGRTPGAPGFLGGERHLPKGMTGAQYAEALKSCGGGSAGTLPRAGAGVSHNPFNNPRFHQVLARFAACLRRNGIAVGEPNTSGKGPIFNTKQINTAGPQFKAAEAQCRSALAGLLQPKAKPGAAGGAKG